MALREPFNSISHMVGAGLALAAAPFLLARAHGAVSLFATATYVVSLAVLFAMSAVYHAITHRGAEAWLLRLDHGTIYLLIAGTYTPVALLLYGGALGWTLFGIEWGIAIAGMATTLTIHGKPKWIDQVAYLALGWGAVAVPGPLAKVGWSGLAWLLAGGVIYSAGAALYGRNRDRRVFGDHEVWHLMVLAGAACHAVFIAAYILA